MGASSPSICKAEVKEIPGQDGKKDLPRMGLPPGSKGRFQAHQDKTSIPIYRPTSIQWTLLQAAVQVYEIQIQEEIKKKAMVMNHGLLRILIGISI